MGDPSTPEGKAQLIRQSPLFSADKIVAPLMVVQGQNDPRVVKAESDQIVVALRDRGFQVHYINAPDEGHGFARPENNMAFVAATEKFLAQHIGGRYQADMPENIAKRLQEITVDVTTVTLPEAIDAEEAVKKLMPVRELKTGELSYNVSLQAFGMELKTKITIEKEGDLLIISESTQTPMGNAVDMMKLHAADLTPSRREINQGQVKIIVDYHENKVEGEIDMGAQKVPVNVEPEGPLFAEGPARFLLLATLPLADGYSVLFRNIDMASMSEKMFRLATSSDTMDDGTQTWRLDVAPADGSPGSQVIWIDKQTYSVLKYEQVVPEMGGMTMVGTLVR